MFSCIHSTCTNAITASDHTGTQYTRCVGGGGEDDGDGGDRWGDGDHCPDRRYVYCTLWHYVFTVTER